MKLKDKNTIIFNICNNPGFKNSKWEGLLWKEWELRLRLRDPAITRIHNSPRKIEKPLENKARRLSCS